VQENFFFSFLRGHKNDDVEYPFALHKIKQDTKPARQPGLSVYHITQDPYIICSNQVLGHSATTTYIGLNWISCNDISQFPGKRYP
jgi:hypothetical protein